MAEEELGGQTDTQPAAEAQREPTAEEREAMRRFEQEIGKLTVVDHLELMLHSLSSMAVNRLGAGQGGPGRKDLEQARTAIDAFRALSSVLEGKLPTDRLAAHRGALSQMQMAFVAMSAPAVEGDAASGSEGGSEAQGGSEAGGGDDA